MSRFLALLGNMRLPTRNAQGICALVSLLAPETQTSVSDYEVVRVPVGVHSGLGQSNRVMRWAIPCRKVEANALPEARLQGWHQVMTQLEVLTGKLNSADMQRGKYLTVSELKSSVFAITQTLSQNEPVEEQLRQMTQLQQLMNRYTLIMQPNKEGN